MVDHFVPAAPKCFCNKCGKEMIVKVKQGLFYYLDTGNPKWFVVKLQCPEVSWFFGTRAHSIEWAAYPMDENKGRSWYRIPYTHPDKVTFDGDPVDDTASVEEWWKDSKQKKRVLGTADVVDSFIETGKKAKENAP